MKVKTLWHCPVCSACVRESASGFSSAVCSPVTFRQLFDYKRIIKLWAYGYARQCHHPAAPLALAVRNCKSSPQACLPCLRLGLLLGFFLASFFCLRLSGVVVICCNTISDSF